MKKAAKKTPIRTALAPASQDLRRLEQAKLEAMKELAYGASHEINNPLANIATRAQTLLKLESDPEKRRMLAAIHAQAMRAHEMIADLMLFARPPELVKTAIDLRGLVERVAAEMASSASAQGTQLVCENSQQPIVLSADATQLAIALRALVQNSLEALGREGRIELTLSADVSAISITVSDDGPGIPPEIRPHIFEPFYSGREAGRGLGFGLSKCWRIVTSHGGGIDLLPATPAWKSIFRISLPPVAQPETVY